MSNHPIGLVEVGSADPAAASRFYGALFDWQVAALPAGPDDFYHIHLAPEHVSCAFPPATQIASMAPSGSGSLVTFYVTVDDIDATLARVNKLGGHTVAGKVDIPTGSFAFFADPTGNLISLYTPLAPLT